MRESKTKYWLSIDIMRAIAILLMIQVHFVNNLSSRRLSSANYYELSNILGMVSAPIFSFLVGLSLWLWLSKGIQVGKTETELRKIVFRRGILLFGAGLVFATFIWLPESIFEWDILTFLGTATIITYVLRKLSKWKLVGTILLVLLVSPILRSITGYAAHWKSAEYIYEFTIQDIVLGFLLEGYFPILPWIVFPLLGLFVGRYFFARNLDKQYRGKGFPILGICFVGFAGIGSLLQSDTNQVLEFYFGEMTFYPASTTYLVGLMGVLLLGFWRLFSVFDSRQEERSGKFWDFFRRYSRFSLTTYVVHHAVHIWPLYLLALYEGRSDPWWYYEDAVSTPTALLLALLFIVGFYGVLSFMEKKKEYGFEGMLRWLSDP